MFSFTKFTGSARVSIPLAALFLCHNESTLSTACQETYNDKKIAFTNPKEFVPFPIQAIEQISPNTKRIEIALPSKDHEMGLPTASFLIVKGPLIDPEENKYASKAYTPISTNSERNKLT